MKALVLELEDGRIAALREDGEIVTARQEWPVGETIELDDADLELPENVTRLPVRKHRWAQAAVAAALAFVLLSGSYAYTTAWACSYVSLETEEASVELAVNRLGRVIEVKALNADSEELAEALTAELRHKPVEEALEQTVERFREDGRIAEDEAILAGVTDKNEQRAADLTEKVEHALGGQNDLRTVEVGPEQREEARDQDMGGGRFVWEQRTPESTPAPEMAAEGTEPPLTNGAPKEKPEEHPQQIEEQAAPGKSAEESEPPAQPTEPNRSEQAVGTVPPQTAPQPSEQQTEPTPAAPAERREEQASVPQQPQREEEQPRQPASGDTGRQTPSGGTASGSPPEARQETDPPPQGGVPGQTGSQQPGEIRR